MGWMDDQNSYIQKTNEFLIFLEVFFLLLGVNQKIMFLIEVGG